MVVAAPVVILVQRGIQRLREPCVQVPRQRRPVLARPPPHFRAVQPLRHNQQRLRRLPHFHGMRQAAGRLLSCCFCLLVRIPPLVFSWRAHRGLRFSQQGVQQPCHLRRCCGGGACSKIGGRRREGNSGLADPLDAPPAGAPFRQFTLAGAPKLAYRHSLNRDLLASLGLGLLQVTAKQCRFKQASQGRWRSSRASAAFERAVPPLPPLCSSQCDTFAQFGQPAAPLTSLALSWFSGTQQSQSDTPRQSEEPHGTAVRGEEDRKAGARVYIGRLFQAAAAAEARAAACAPSCYA